MTVRANAFDAFITDSKHDIPHPNFRDLAKGLFGHLGEVAAGQAAGTGSSLDIATPFDPAAVILFNATQSALWIKFPTQADDDTCLVTTAAASDTSGGITLGTLKFNLGTDSAINQASDVIHWVAFAFKNIASS